MKVDRLEIQGFRNISSLCISPAEGANILCGDNAQGKTNLLEALWLFCGAKSFRGAQDREMIPFGQDFSRLELAFTGAGRRQTASLAIGADQKTASLNGVKLESAAKLAEEFCAVVFSPDHLQLIKQGPERRRRLLDLSLCQVYPKYAKVLENYHRALRQRNALLKDAARHPFLMDTLEVWESSLAELGGYLDFMRFRYVKRLGELAAEIYGGLSGGREDFSVLYDCGLPRFSPGEDSAAALTPERQELCRALEQKLCETRGEDMERGFTSAGPHRDDLDIRVAGKKARAFASQGQQRSCVLALKLAECGILEQSRGEAPVVLLDDVMSELDQGRRSYLLNRLRGRQIFITCCDPSAFDTLRDGAVFMVRDGQLLE